ncbi:hypothetical protein FDJ23_gp043 [Erwinia phage vB_EamM_Desertfox]|uniref:Uncharacterized protein n=2 Tax=Agricanvirus TaxID=1984776 RepID=A0A482IGL6_9CAUD|nr:hypothetical protein FDJ23_gp043 [Erwinia phage vB_EamM_Desertfox]AUG86151.1 hypothetical protein DESERTFOX_43 [Erwinia phage vB_EamM_Desertfox]QBP07151.1 hypothetical protein REBECCA_43 [Erwinia phage Rebecca]
MLRHELITSVAVNGKEYSPIVCPLAKGPDYSRAFGALHKAYRDAATYGSQIITEPYVKTICGLIDQIQTDLAAGVDFTETRKVSDGDVAISYQITVRTLPRHGS